MDYSHLQAAQLDEKLFAHASLNRDDSVALLKRLAELCRPYDGEEPIILFAARIAMRVWLKGCIHLEIQSLSHDTNLFSLSAEDGAAIDTLFEDRLRSSFSRMRLIAEDPLAIQPFHLYEAAPNRLKLEAMQLKRNSTMPPVAFLDANAEMNRCRDLYFESQRPAWSQDFDDEAVTQVWRVAPRIQDVLGLARNEPSAPEIDATDIESVFDETSWPEP